MKGLLYTIEKEKHNEKDLKEILCFREPALSDPNLTIEMHMMISSKPIDVELVLFRL